MSGEGPQLPDNTFEVGTRLRREILGDAHVEQAARNQTEFDRDFQEFITRYSWGEIWSRPGLDRRTRSCMTIAIAIALNRPEELALHIKVALRNGVTIAEISEVLLHTTIYCGIPAANGAFRVAKQVLASAPGADSE